jgi:hypothetical protein
MSRVRFEPTTPVFDRAKKVHVLDLAATVIGRGITLPTPLHKHVSEISDT